MSLRLPSLWPNVIAYALSFAVIGIMWQNHHALFRLVERVDRITVFLNLLLLAGTAFIPFATAALGAYPAMPPHLVRRRAFIDSVDDAAVKWTVRTYRVGWGIYVLATLLALLAPIASFAAYVAVAIYYLVPRGVDADI